MHASFDSQVAKELRASRISTAFMRKWRASLDASLPTPLLQLAVAYLGVRTNDGPEPDPEHRHELELRGRP